VRQTYVNKSLVFRFLSIFFVFATYIYSQNVPHVYINTSISEISPGDIVAVELGVSEGDSIKSVLLLLDYNEDLFDYIDGKSGDLFQGATFIDIHQDTIETNVLVYLFGAKMGAGQFVSAPGSFFLLQFVAIDTGDAIFKLDSLLFYNSNLDRYSGTSDTLISIVTADTFPPDPITDFKVLDGSEELSFSWRNPTDPDFEGTLILRSEKSYIDSVSSTATIAYDGASTSFTDQGLTNNTIYYYSAFSYDEVLNYSTPVFLKAEPREEFVYAYPNPFNPDEQNVGIKIIFPNDAFIDVSIYDAVGELVLKLVENYPITGGVQNFLQWDGRNGNSDIVANGVYYLVVQTGQGKDRIEKIAILR